MTLLIVSNIVIYVCLSILMGSFILQLLPAHTRPNVFINRGWLAAAALGVSIFSFVPLLLLMWDLQETSSWGEVLQSVLLTFAIGKAWIFTAAVSIILFLFSLLFFQKKNPNYAWIGCFLTILLILGLSWSSHAGSLAQIGGLFNHMIHYTAVSIWIGMLLVVSWFARGRENWANFLTWFTVIALTCLFFLTASGIALMGIMMDISRYIDTWVMSYGHLLLWKHILFAAILLFAVINGILMKKKLYQPEFNPFPWLKAESGLALLIFSVTAALSEQTPPTAREIGSEGVPLLLDFFYQGQYEAGMTVQLTMNAAGLSIFTLAGLFAGLIFYAFYKNAPAIVTFGLSIFFVFSLYVGLVMSIS